jgi:hypothetical protein
MPLIRKFARQTHYVPKGPYGMRNIFDQGLFANNHVAYEDYESDSLHEALDDIRMFKCTFCGEILYEDEVDLHECEEE